MHHHPYYVYVYVLMLVIHVGPSVRPSGAVVQLPRFPVPGMVPHPIYRPAMVPPPPPPPPPSSKLAELQLELDTHPVIILPPH